jgi:hypothetical protein
VTNSRININALKSDTVTSSEDTWKKKLLSEVNRKLIENLQLA